MFKKWKKIIALCCLRVAEKFIDVYCNMNNNKKKNDLLTLKFSETTLYSF